MARQNEMQTSNKIKNGVEKVTHYKQLQIWQKAITLTKLIYKLTDGFPDRERFGLTSQMRRAVVSVPSNIAEGQARHGTREFLQFLSHASGSLAELETQVFLSEELGFCEHADVAQVNDCIAELQKMLAAIRQKLSEKAMVASASH